jgi:hypothetical protein
MEYLTDARFGKLTCLFALSMLEVLGIRPVVGPVPGRFALALEVRGVPMSIGYMIIPTVTALSIAGQRSQSGHACDFGVIRNPSSPGGRPCIMSCEQSVRESGKRSRSQAEIWFALLRTAFSNKPSS